MTKEQANSLRVGDIVEHQTDNNYWLAKLVRFENGYWRVKNHGKGASGVHGAMLPESPENFTLVGHSDAP